MNGTPASEHDLLTRAKTLAGITLQQLASQLAVPLPANMTQAKGWTGNLLELALGATASSTPQPDFVNLGIELKTLPVNSLGRPKESTYVCVVQLNPTALANWETSLVREKLAQVLWIPYEADNRIPMSARRIGSPILWRPSPEQQKQLRHDWQELTDMIVLGQIEQISSSMGKYLQIRPKAANSRMRVRDRNQPGTSAITLPRGFYLRPCFTRQVLEHEGNTG